MSISILFLLILVLGTTFIAGAFVGCVMRTSKSKESKDEGVFKRNFD